MRKEIKIFLLFALTLIVLFACKKKEEDKKGETIFAVDVTKAIKGEINDFIELNGDIKAKDEVDLYPDVAGKFISKSDVNLGKSVNRNQVIGYVDPSKPGMDYRPSPVRSTISGVITSLPIKNGATVSPQTSVAKVGKIEDLEVISYISEKYVSKMKQGLAAIVKTQAYPNIKLDAYIKELSPVIDPVTRMMEVKLSFKEKNEILKPGMFGEIKIITEKKDNIVKIPVDCMVKRFGAYYVYVVHKDKENNEAYVEQRKVTYGIQIEDKVEITEGLKPGEEIVLSGQSLLEDKAKVKIIKTSQPLIKEDIIE
jgi:multidrug efflux pump subunit AcrA (membrane-fusion protein)